MHASTLRVMIQQSTTRLISVSPISVLRWGLAIWLAMPCSSQAAVAEPVQVRVDLTARLVRGEQRGLRRAAYFNMHASPWEFSAEEQRYLVDELGVNFGRSLGGLSNFMRGLEPDPNRPGFAAPGHLRRAAELAAVQAKAARRRAPGVESEMIAAAHPSIYYHHAKPGDDHASDHDDAQSDAAQQERERFVPGSHEAAAEIVATYFEAIGEQGAAYFEVTNEGNVHARRLGTTFNDMTQLHRVVAKQVRQRNPWLKVGGPSSAWPAFEVKDFEVWRAQMGHFIEHAGRDLDFLSVHLYTTHWDDQVNDRFGANTDAILDLMENHSLLHAGEVKPLMISEGGTGFRKGEAIHDEYSLYRDWLVIRGANHMAMTLMRRDGRLVKFIPFIVGKATWYQAESPYPWAMFHRHPAAVGTAQGQKAKPRWETTNLTKWFEFWREVQGEHLPLDCVSGDKSLAGSESLDLQAQAFLDDKTVYLCLDSLAQQPQEVDVQALLGEGLCLESASIRRLYCSEDRLPVLEIDLPWQQYEERGGALERLVLRADEAVILKLSLNDRPIAQTVYQEQTFYGDQTVVKIGQQPTRLEIEVPGSALPATKATLRVGYARQRDLGLVPRIWFNGQQLDVPSEDRGSGKTNSPDYFATKEIDVPASLIRKQNQLKVSFGMPGGHISSATLTLRSLEN